jgi:uncharacterized OB-fold protein
MTLPPLLLSRCESCSLRYLPREGPCPRCGAVRPAPLPVPPVGHVLAATELLSPAAGWPSPHRLALVEVAEAVRLLARVDGELPALGATVGVTKDGEAYRVVIAGDAAGRGEGDSPRSGSVPASFEPPR